MLTPRHLELIFYKARADLRAEAAKTYIGFLWWVLDPIIFMVIFYVVFGLLFQRTMENYVQFLLVGLVFWRWFQNTVTQGANTILGNSNLMRQVYLPKIIFPLVTVITNSAKFAFVLALLLAYLWMSGFPVNLTYLALPFLLAVQLTLIVATTCFVAALVPFLPDFKLLVDYTLQILFFLSGIFYAGSDVPEKYQFYFYLNPIANLIDAYREILIHGRWPDWSSLTLIGVVAVLIGIVSYGILARYDRVYPKVVI